MVVPLPPFPPPVPYIAFSVRFTLYYCVGFAWANFDLTSFNSASCLCSCLRLNQKAIVPAATATTTTAAIVPPAIAPALTDDPIVDAQELVSSISKTLRVTLPFDSEMVLVGIYTPHVPEEGVERRGMRPPTSKHSGRSDWISCTKLPLESETLVVSSVNEPCKLTQLLENWIPASGAPGTTVKLIATFVSVIDVFPTILRITAEVTLMAAPFSGSVAGFTGMIHLVSFSHTARGSGCGGGQFAAGACCGGSTGAAGETGCAGAGLGAETGAAAGG